LPRPWTPETIEFLCTRIGSNKSLFDVYSVYTEAKIDSKEQRELTAPVQPEEVNQFLTSFAQLLAEIELGTPIDRTMNLEEVNRFLRKKMKELERERGGEYWTAVMGCLQVKTIFTKLKNEQPHVQDPEHYRSLIRQAVYDRVILPLETNLVGVPSSILRPFLQHSRGVGGPSHISALFPLELPRQNGGPSGHLPTDDYQLRSLHAEARFTRTQTSQPSMLPKGTLYDGIPSVTTNRQASPLSFIQKKRYD
jgi:hypothetical protein